MKKEKIKTLLEQLNKGIVEKEEIMTLALLSSIQWGKEVPLNFERIFFHH